MKWMRHLALFGLLLAGSGFLAACGDDSPSGPDIPDPPEQQSLSLTELVLLSAPVRGPAKA